MAYCSYESPLLWDWSQCSAPIEVAAKATTESMTSSSTHGMCAYHAVEWLKHFIQDEADYTSIELSWLNDFQRIYWEPAANYELDAGRMYLTVVSSRGIVKIRPLAYR